MSVTVRSAVKRFGSMPALAGVDLEAKAARSTVLLGPSGCGKTTLLRCVAGLEQPDDGEIVIRDRTVFSAKSGRNIPAERRNIGFVHQSYALWPHLLVRENVAYPLLAHGWPSKKIAGRVEEVLRILEMDWAAERLPSKLSGGQQQRVALARALVFEPEVLLLDEPLSNLDLKLREQMRYEIRSLQRRLGVTLLYVTHDQAEAMAIADTVVVMLRGRVEQVGTPEDVYDRPANRFVASFVGTASFIDGVIEGCGGSGGVVTTSTGTKIRVSDRRGYSPHVRVSVCLRPHWLRTQERPGDLCLGTGQLVSATYFGAHTELIVRIHGEHVRVHLPGRGGAGIRDGVSLYYDPAEVCIVKDGDGIPSTETEAFPGTHGTLARSAFTATQERLR